MTFDEFWSKVLQGGTAPMRRGGKINYSVINENNEEKLHIKSTNSSNEFYFITKEKAEEYFKDPKNPNHHWFNTVFENLNK